MIRRKITTWIVIGWRSARCKKKIIFIVRAKKTMKVLCFSVPSLHRTRTGLYIVCFGLCRGSQGLMHNVDLVDAFLVGDESYNDVMVL